MTVVAVITVGDMSEATPGSSQHPDVPGAASRGRPGAAWGSVPVTRRTRMPWARCVLKRQVQLAVRGVGFVVVRFVEPQHVWDLGIGAVRHERISIGAGDGREGNRSTDRGCGQPRCDVVQFDPHGGSPSWKLNLDSL